MERAFENRENLLHLLTRKKDLFEEFLSHTRKLATEAEGLDMEKVAALIAKRGRLISAIERIDKRIEASGSAKALSSLPDSHKGEITQLFESMRSAAKKAAELTGEFEASMNRACRHFRNEISRIGLRKPGTSTYGGTRSHFASPRFLDTRL